MPSPTGAYIADDESAMISFHQLVGVGGKEGARTTFERLIGQLVGLRYAGMKIVEANRGDWGLDVIVGEPQKGRDAARDKVIKIWVTAVPDLTWKMTGEPIESANGVAFEFTFAGTNTGAWGPDTPATGKPFSFNGVTFMRVENGKIVYQGDWYDGLGIQKQLGWVQ